MQFWATPFPSRALSPQLQTISGKCVSRWGAGEVVGFAAEEEEEEGYVEVELIAVVVAAGLDFGNWIPEVNSNGNKEEVVELGTEAAEVLVGGLGKATFGYVEEIAEVDCVAGAECENLKNHEPFMHLCGYLFME